MKAYQSVSVKDHLSVSDAVLTALAPVSDNDLSRAHHPLKRVEVIVIIARCTSVLFWTENTDRLRFHAAVLEVRCLSLCFIGRRWRWQCPGHGKAHRKEEEQCPTGSHNCLH